MKCLVCRNVMNASWSPATLFKKDWVCSNCTSLLTPLRAGCPQCGHPTENGKTCMDCIRWLGLGSNLVTRTLFEYDEAGVNWLHRFKFSGDVALVHHVREVLKKEREPGVIYVPIPLGNERLSSRRFNQAEVLARAIGKTKCLLSKKEVSSQRELGKVQRRNRPNPFTIHTILACGKIVLVDDVYTTGTTLHQAAFMLRAAGYKQVSAICLFRALNKSK